MTFRSWQTMFSRRSVRALLWLSLLLAAASAWAQDGSGLAERADKVKTRDEFSKFLESADQELKYPGWIDEVEASLKNYGLETAKREFASHLTADGMQTSAAPTGEVGDANAEAKEILSNPSYRDAGPTASSNWIGNAIAATFEAIGKWLADILRLFQPPEMNAAMPNLSAGAVAARVFMYILGIALVAFVVYFAIKMSRGRQLRRKAGGLLDDDEPDRTADEWLTQADLLNSQGRYREAVRCLYLACLVRFDDAGVAAFDRGQTNWEHLYRISASPKKPPGLDFRPATKSFDLFWYDYAPINQDDVAEFRALYDRLLHDLGFRAAA